MNSDLDHMDMPHRRERIVPRDRLISTHAVCEGDELLDATTQLYAKRIGYAVADAIAAGLVVTIELQPTSPPAIGEYDTLITVRRERNSS